MIKFGVCDDDIQFAHKMVERIRELYARMVPERILCDVIVEFTSAEDVLYYLSYNTLDILFLDIVMPVCNGFRLAKELKRTYPDIILVFVSSYNNLVFKSFDYNPLCFLRKSHLDQEFAPAFARVIDTFLYSKDTLDFSTTEGSITLMVKDIVYFESQKNYFNIYCRNTTYKCRGTLSQAEQMVCAYDFFRIHAAYLVNFDNIYRPNGDKTLQMNNNVLLPVSQRRYAEFKIKYTKYIQRRGEK